MKKFLGIFGCVFVFLFFGGAALFDFHQKFYITGAMWAFVAALIIYGFLSLSDKIEELEKRVKDLENR